MGTAGVEFVFGLAVMVFGSWLLPPLGDWLAEKAALPEGLLGLVTALAADTPEISSGIAAVVLGAHDVGMGVVLGSNIFNLAALLGGGALVAAKVAVRPRSLLLHGGMSLVVTALAAGLVTRVIGPGVTTLLLIAVIVPYVAVLALGRSELRRLPIPSRAGRALALAVEETQEDENVAEKERRPAPGDPSRIPGWAPVLFAIGALAAVIGGSTAMVRGALTLAPRLDIPRVILGPVVLAALTGIPNVYTGLRLARSGRGRAVVSETLNSNTINILVGLSLPALVFGVSRPSPSLLLETAWVFGLTAVVVVVGAHGRGFTRRSGGVLVALYAAFVAARVMA